MGLAELGTVRQVLRSHSTALLKRNVAKRRASGVAVRNKLASSPGIDGGHTKVGLHSYGSYG